ncbi:ATP-dependent RNA helicase DDX51, partial [Clarias magur]
MALFMINRYLGEEEEEIKSNGESRSKALLSKLQERARTREQQGLANKKRPDVQDTQMSEKDGVGKTKRKHEEQEKEKKQLKKKKKESSSEQDHADETPAEAADLGPSEQSRKKRKKKDKQGSGNQEEKQHTDVVGEEVDEPESQKSASAQSEPSHTRSSFHILGGFENKPVQKVQRVLPKWLAEPDMIVRDIKSNLIPLGDVPGICPSLQKKLEANGIQTFFPVQAEVIPAVLESVNSGLLIGRGGYRPRDICVSAPTGSGKTLAFVIPVIQALMTRVVCEVRALAMLPTKELAQQVYKVFCTYAEGTGLKVVMAAGQKPFAVEQSTLLEVRRGVSRSLADIVIATPGRLVDHINKTEGFSLEHLRFLIIDEADRMIDSMQQAWLNQVTKAVYKSGRGSGASIFTRMEPGPITVASLSPPQMPLQKLLFSATLTQNPEKLQQMGLHQPRLFSSTHTSTTSEEKFNFPQGLTEYYVCCTLSKKPLLILHFLLRLKFNPVLCFTNSREAAHRLLLLVRLYGGVDVAEFSSRLNPSERQKTLKSFERGKIQLLISTDAAARGIDIKGVKCVINYDAPQYIRTYIHRVGRTARAGKAGVAFTFVLGVQEERFVKMVQEAGSPGLQKQTVNPESLSGMESRYEDVLNELGRVIKTKLLELEEVVQRAAADKAREQIGRSEAEEQIRRQTEQLALLEGAHQRRQQSAQSIWKQEKESLLLNISSTAKTVQEMKNQMQSLRENLSKVQKELQLCKNNMNTLNKKLTYDMTQCNTQILAQKEECNEKVAAAKLEVQKKYEKQNPAGGAAGVQPAVESTQEAAASKPASEALNGNDSTKTAGEQEQTKHDSEPKAKTADPLETNEIPQDKAVLATNESGKLELLTTSLLHSQNSTMKSLTKAMEAVMDVKEDALLDAAAVTKGKEEDAIEYDNDGEIEKRLSKLK